MEIIRDAQIIKTRMEQFQASQDLRQRKTMSVPEMRKLLGLKKPRVTGSFIEIFLRLR